MNLHWLPSYMFGIFLRLMSNQSMYGIHFATPTTYYIVSQICQSLNTEKEKKTWRQECMLLW